MLQSRPELKNADRYVDASEFEDEQSMRKALLNNSADGDPTGALQEAVEDAWKKYEQAEQAMDAKKQEEDAAEKAYGGCSD